MAYNHGREDRKWRIWKEAEEKLLRECGVDEATIEQIRIADRADFNSNRRFYRWTNDVAEYLEDMADRERQTEVGTVAELLDEIESENLYQVLVTVDGRTLKIVLLKMQGYSTKEIAGTGIFSNGTSGTGSLTRYGTKPFTDGRCVCLRALMNAWLRKNGMKRSIRRLGAFQRYKGGVSCSTTSMSSIFTKSPLWSIAPLRQYRNLLRLQRRK